jgi:hypothetical protein
VKTLILNSFRNDNNIIFYNYYNLHSENNRYLLNGNLLHRPLGFRATHLLRIKREAIVCVVFKLEVADIVGGGIDVNNLRIRHGDVDVEETDRETYDENRKGYILENV